MASSLLGASRLVRRFYSYMAAQPPAIARADDAPAWFHLAMQQILAPVNQRLDELEIRFDDLAKIRLDRLEVALAKTTRLSAMNHNLQAGSGITRFFEVVLFRDGSDPTSEQHGLPAGELRGIRLSYSGADNKVV